MVWLNGVPADFARLFQRDEDGCAAGKAIGFDPTHAIELTIAPAFNRFPQGQRTNDYYQQMLDSLNTTPGVISSAVVTGAPLGGFLMTSPILIAGRPAPAGTDAQLAPVTVISPDYFRVIGTPLKDGRFFTERDGESKPRVAIINEAMARRYFPDESPRPDQSD